MWYGLNFLLNQFQGGISMSEEEINDLIQSLDHYIIDNEICVFPEKQTFDCCDCTLCKDDFFKKIRNKLNE